MLRYAILPSLALLLASAAPVKESPAASMLVKLGELEGQWEGNFAWTGAREGTGAIAAKYTFARLKGSVTEELITEGKPYMTSVYHLDGPDLRVTHFCVQSQPRLKADKLDPTSASAHFAFVDVTNAGPKSGFVEEITIERPSDRKLRIVFVFKGNGPRAVETIDLTRVA